MAKYKFQLTDAATALDQLIREYLFPLSLWNLKVTKLEYKYTWKMVKYLLRMKFPNHPDYQWAFDKIVLTQETDQEPIEGETPVPSSEELSEYEYDVLLYLKEDKERRKKTIKEK